MAYDAMLPYWAKIQTLLDGTDAMRAARQTYLPQHEEESTPRTTSARPHHPFEHAPDDPDAWVGKPFSDPIEIGRRRPRRDQGLGRDIDLQGNNLDVFARNWFKDGLAKGFSHVLVEFPRPLPRADGNPAPSRTTAPTTCGRIWCTSAGKLPLRLRPNGPGRRSAHARAHLEEHCVLVGFEEKVRTASA
jgi:hypothetical protein